MKHRLMNAAEELAGETPTTSDNSDVAAGKNMFEELGIDPSKYGFDENDTGEVIDDTAQAAQEEVPGQAIDENSYLDWVNSLGAERNGEQVKVESVEEVKNALQMYEDYTHKTQALSEERKAFESERTQATELFEKSVADLNASIEAHQKQLEELQTWTFAFNQLKEESPDLFEEVQRFHGGIQKQYSNPILDQQLKALRAEIDPLKKAVQSRENELILKGFESEKAQLSTTEQSLKELGINVDWDGVKKRWADTGLPVKEVIGAMYFESIQKAQASKAKVADVTKKVSAKPTGAAAVSRPGTRAPDIKGMSYSEAAKKLYQQLKG